jgi:hypothetical protein
MRAFIYASGQAKRFPGMGVDILTAEGQYKQLLEVDGEPLIVRTIRQLRARDCDVVVVTPHDVLVAAILGCPRRGTDPQISIVEVGTPNLFVETVARSAPKWADGLNLGLLGDCFFSEYCMDKMVAAKEMMFFGRPFPSSITGNCASGEPFGWVWRHPHDWHRTMDAIKASVEQANANPEQRDMMGTPLGSLWQLYRGCVGYPLEHDVSLSRERFFVVNDFTDDFDTMENFENWKLRYDRRIIRQARIKLEERPTAAADQAPLRYVVLSTGHSGTGYAAKLLTSAGVPCGHESIFTRNGVVGRPSLQADSSFHAVGYLDHPICQGAKLVHLVRHPLKVIRSWLHGGTHPENDTWGRKICDWPNGKQTARALAWRYINWNKLIEERAPDAILVRAEDRKEMLTELGFHPDSAEFDNVEYNRKPGAVGKPEVTLLDVGDARDELVAMAERYGYIL